MAKPHEAVGESAGACARDLPPLRPSPEYRNTSYKRRLLVPVAEAPYKKPR